MGEELQLQFLRVILRRGGRVEQVTTYSIVASFSTAESARLAAADLGSLGGCAVRAQDKILRVHSDMA